MTDRLDLRLVRPCKAVSNTEAASVATWGKALSKAVQDSGLKDKALAIEVDLDAAQFSRTVSGQLGIMPDKLFRLMDACGTEFPLLWLMYQRGYDVEAMRQRETELQKQLREANERAAAAEAKLATITDFVKQARAA